MDRSLIHEILVAYFRTSEYGAWSVDGETGSDLFNLHFIRGNWNKAFFSGKRVPGKCGSIGTWPDVKPDVSTASMLVAVTVRPTPRELTITLRQSIFPDRGMRDIWERAAIGEAQSLREYLRKCYDLPESPGIQSEPSS